MIAEWQVGQALGGWSGPSQRSGPWPWCLASGVSLALNLGAGRARAQRSFHSGAQNPTPRAVRPAGIGKVWDPGSEGILIHWPGSPFLSLGLTVPLYETGPVLALWGGVSIQWDDPCETGGPQPRTFGALRSGGRDGH